MKLYGYFRSSAAFRVRIALNLKGLAYRQVSVNLREGEQNGRAYRAINPQGLVPALVTEEGEVLSQSVAILEWLEEAYPQPALLPDNARARARVRELVNLIACDIHPLNNLRVLRYLSGPLGCDEEQQTQWYHHWVHAGFRALEARIGEGPYCAGERLSLADVCLVPQVYNARRFAVELEDYPLLMAVYERCMALTPFIQAAPDGQPDRV